LKTLRKISSQPQPKQIRKQADPLFPFETVLRLRHPQPHDRQPQIRSHGSHPERSMLRQEEDGHCCRPLQGWSLSPAQRRMDRPLGYRAGAWLGFGLAAILGGKRGGQQNWTRTRTRQTCDKTSTQQRKSRQWRKPKARSGKQEGDSMGFRGITGEMGTNLLTKLFNHSLAPASSRSTASLFLWSSPRSCASRYERIEFSPQHASRHGHHGQNTMGW
jgi:hypothetical protein